MRRLELAANIIGLTISVLFIYYLAILSWNSRNILQIQEYQASWYCKDMWFEWAIITKKECLYYDIIFCDKRRTEFSCYNIWGTGDITD